MSLIKWKNPAALERDSCQVSSLGEESEIEFQNKSMREQWASEREGECWAEAGKGIGRVLKGALPSTAHNGTMGSRSIWPSGENSHCYDFSPTAVAGASRFQGHECVDNRSGKILSHPGDLKRPFMTYLWHSCITYVWRSYISPCMLVWARSSTYYVATSTTCVHVLSSL